MKLIIDIPTDLYNKLVKNKKFYTTTTIFSAITNGTPYDERPQGDLISRSALKEAFEEIYPLATNEFGGIVNKEIYDTIDNAPAVEVPENEVNCVLTMFGKCSYNETGCSDCEIKDKIRKALAERPQGEWIDEGQYAEGHSEHAYICKNCGYQIIENPNMIFENRFCKYCGAKMKGGAE